MIPAEVLRFVNSQYNLSTQARDYNITPWKVARDTFYAITPTINPTRKYLIGLMNDPAKQNIDVFEDTHTFFELIQTFQGNIKRIAYSYSSGRSHNERDATYQVLALLLQTQFVTTYPNVRRNRCIDPKLLKDLMMRNFFTEEIFINIINDPHPQRTARQIMYGIAPHDPNHPERGYSTTAYILPIVIPSSGVGEVVIPVAVPARLGV